MRVSKWMATFLASVLVWTAGPVSVQAEEVQKAPGLSVLVKRVLEEYQKDSSSDGIYFSIYSMPEMMSEIPDQQVTFDFVDPQSGRVTPHTTGSFKSYWKQLNDGYAVALDDDQVFDDRPEGTRVSRMQWGQFCLLDAYYDQYQHRLTERQKGILDSARAILLLVQMRQSYSGLNDMNFYEEILRREGQGISEISRLDYGIANQLFNRARTELEQGKVDEPFEWLYRSFQSSYRVMRVHDAQFSKANYEQDSDGDQVLDLLELIYQTNFLRADSDGDGLTDRFELGHSDPNKRDSRDTGVEDSLRDDDEDGLDNLAEQRAGTDPGSADSDQDHLSDGDEVNKYKTNPNRYDTDKDSVSDAKEVEIGTDPVKFDTDGDGKSDFYTKVVEPVELIESTLAWFTEAGVIPHVVIEGRSNAGEMAIINDAYHYNSIIESIPAMVGHPFELSTHIEFDKATITLQVTEKAGPVDMKGLRVALYDQEKQRMFFFKEQTIDAAKKTITVETDREGIYVLLQYE